MRPDTHRILAPDDTNASILSVEREELLRQTRQALGELRDAIGQAQVTDEERNALADSIRQLDELFLLVIAGEFNSGKSSLINALLGYKLQEEGVTPTTSHIHLIKYGAEATRQPDERGVWVQTANIPLLRTINIVDTPGTNAIMREHEALTAEFIPRSDLVLFITSADRPFSESERQFLNQIKEWGKKIVLVVNKMDILTDQAEREKVLEFVRKSAESLIGGALALFGISARQAQRAKGGDPRAWDASGFQSLEDFVYKTLDEAGRFQLKLLNPLGVGRKLITRQMEQCQADLDSLAADTQLVQDIEQQHVVYNTDMQRNFKARLGEIDNLLFEAEKRGNVFFDDMFRIGRITDLMRKEKIQREFELHVISDMPQQIETRVGELIDWLVEQDLRQWTAVADHLQERRRQYADRIIGQGGPREGTLAYDRQRLVESIGLATRQAVATYDRETESARLAEAAREAVINTGLSMGGVGLGVALAILVHSTFLDVTGILAGITALTVGLLVIPARRRKAKQELATRLGELREKLMTGLNDQFEREMRRSARRIEDVTAPFSRFVRAENEKVVQRRTRFEALGRQVDVLRQQVQTE